MVFEVILNEVDGFVKKYFVDFDWIKWCGRYVDVFLFVDVEGLYFF